MTRGSRMESGFRDPKTPSAWVELDFHARQRRLKVWKRRLTWGTLLLCLGLVGAGLCAGLTARGKGKVTFAARRKPDGTREFVDEPLKDGKDPGLIRFNHQLHLTLKEPKLQGAKVPECVDCHRPDGSKQYMKPISHEEHCARCHA